MVTACSDSGRETTVVSGVFPEAVTDSRHSIKFLSKLFASAISYIAYSRFTFPKESFSTINFDGIEIKMLNRNAKHQPAVVLAEAVKSAVDTLKKGYLKQLTFSIRNEGSVLEVYKFQFGSQENSGLKPMSFKIQCKQMLRRMIAITNTLGELPVSSELSILMELHDFAPKDLCPGDFGKKISPLSLLSTSTSTNIGQVKTQWNSLGTEFGSKGFDPPVDAIEEIVSPRKKSRLLMFQETDCFV